VRFRQTGGVAGSIRGCELDTEALPADDARRLERLLRASDLHTARPVPSPDARDAARYEITVEDERGTVTWVLDDTSVPASAEPLLEVLRAHARPLPLP